MISKGLPSITLEQQNKLFHQNYKNLEADAKRIASSHKSECTKKYGQANWEKLSQEVKDFVVDLRYRGDYTVESRQFLQKHIINNDIEGLKKAYQDNIGYFAKRGCPKDRH